MFIIFFYLGPKATKSPTSSFEVQDLTVLIKQQKPQRSIIITECFAVSHSSSFFLFNCENLTSKLLFMHVLPKMSVADGQHH